MNKMGYRRTDGVNRPTVSFHLIAWKKITVDIWRWVSVLQSKICIMESI